MLELPEIVQKLQKENLNKVSMNTHINYQQVWRIKAGRDCNPGYRIVKTLSDYFLNKLDEDENSLLFELDSINFVYRDGTCHNLSDYLTCDWRLSHQELGELFRSALLYKG